MSRKTCFQPEILFNKRHQIYDAQKRATLLNNIYLFKHIYLTLASNTSIGLQSVRNVSGKMRC